MSVKGFARDGRRGAAVVGFGMIINMQSGMYKRSELLDVNRTCGFRCRFEFGPDPDLRMAHPEQEAILVLPSLSFLVIYVECNWPKALLKVQVAQSPVESTNCHNPYAYSEGQFTLLLWN